MIENKVAAISNNQVVSGENTPEITRLYRDNDGIINASIKYNDNIKEVIPEFLLQLKGVIDCPDLPLNVSRSALQNATSVASTLLTTESVVSIIPEEAPAAPATKICPYCMSEIPIAATRCAYCTSELPAEDTDKEE